MKKAKSEIKVTGRGGTDFQTAINLFEKSDYDGMIIFTDGYAEEPKIHKKNNILWVVNNDFVQKYSWMTKLKKNQITVIKESRKNEKNYFY